MALPANPRCVITGAGGGFGRALAVELAKKGAHLVLSDVDAAGLEESVRIVRAAGAASARGMRCDVTRLDDVKALASSCEGPVHLVVNNAGVSSAGRIGDLPMEDWRWTLDVDLYGVIHGCHVFTPVLRAQGFGHVLNIASAAGLLCAPMMGAYNVAKAGVIALSETLKGELVDSGVGVTVLCPMFFQTNIAKSGRITDGKLREAFEGFVTKGKTADAVARDAIAAVNRGDLYAVPMADGRWLWRLKRMAPRVFSALSAQIAKRALS